MFTMSLVPIAPHGKITDGVTAGRLLTAPDMQTLFVDYYNAINRVTACCSAVQAIEMPVFKKAPAWREDAVKRLMGIKSQAMVWNLSFAPLLKSAPQTIITYDGIFRPKSKEILTHLSVLSDRDSKSDSERLIQNIHELRGGITDIRSLVRGNLTNIADFKKQMANQDDFFAELLKKAGASSQAVKEEIKQLKKDLNELEEKIAKYNIYLAVAGVSIGVGITLCGLGVTFILSTPVICKPLAITLIVVGGLVTLTATVAAIIACLEIKRLASGIKDKKDKLVDLEEDAVALCTFNQQMSGFHDKIITAQGSLGTIGGIWQDFDNSLDGIIRNLAALTPGAARQTYRTLLANMEATQDDWKTMVGYCRNLSSIKTTIDRTPYTLPIDKAA